MNGFILNIGFVTILLLQCFCSNGNKKLLNNTKPPASFLDSIQGNWISANDSLHILNFNGRSLDESYIKELSVKHQYYKIYFSDTSLNENRESLFSDLSIDTSLTTGKYLLKVSVADSRVDCYEIYGFSQDATETTFSMMAVWGKRANIYKRP